MAATTDHQFAEQVRMYRNPMLLDTHMLLSLELRLRSSPIKTRNANSVTGASVWVMYISKNSNMLKIQHSLLNSILTFPAMDFISGQLISLTNPFHRIPGQFVNKHEKKTLVITNIF